MTKSGKSTVSFTLLGKIYRFFDKIRRVKDRLRGPEFLSLKAAPCLSKFTQTWRENRQIAQIWCAFPANCPDMARKSGAQQAHSGLAPPTWREPRPLAAFPHKKPSIHTKWIPGRNHLQPAPAHGADLRRCRRCARTRR